MRGARWGHAIRAERALVCCFALLSFAACSDTDPNAAAANDTDGGPRAEAGVRDVGTPDAEYVGTIYAFSKSYLNDGGLTESYAVTAGFAETPSEVCTDQTPPFAPAECTAQRCVPRTPDPTDGGARPTSGNIAVTGGSDSVSLFFVQGGLYQPWVIFGREMFSGGESLTAASMGEEVPAFTASLIAPERPTLTAPIVPSPGDALEISRAGALMLAWSGAPRGKMRFSLSVLELNERNAIECTFPATENSATVSRALLNTLPAGGGFYEFRLEDAAEVVAGTYQVKFIAATNVVDGAHQWAHGNVTVR